MTAELHRGRCDICRWVGRKLPANATRVTVDSWDSGFRRDTVVTFAGVTR